MRKVGQSPWDLLWKMQMYDYGPFFYYSLTEEEIVTYKLFGILRGEGGKSSCPFSIGSTSTVRIKTHYY